jgi:hypothetical protein
MVNTTKLICCCCGDEYFQLTNSHAMLIKHSFKAIEHIGTYPSASVKATFNVLPFSLD